MSEYFTQAHRAPASIPEQNIFVHKVFGKQPQMKYRGKSIANTALYQEIGSTRVL